MVLPQPKSQSEFWQFWLKYQPYLSQRCLHWMGGNRTLAEEALSSAMIKARSKWPRYAIKIKNPKAWLSRFTHNHCVDLHCAYRRQVTSVDNFDEVIDKAISLTNVPSPNTDLLQRELRAYLHQIIEALPPRLRQPFILRFLKEISYRDIANQLSISETTVRKRVQQARSILREQLKHYLADHPILNVKNTIQLARELEGDDSQPANNTVSTE